MSEGVMIFIEQRQGSLKKASLEALSTGRRIADELSEPVAAFCIGTSHPSLAELGADRRADRRDQEVQMRIAVGRGRRPRVG
jgi:electron transfer flavoprotein alpha subunit